jgi:hypothetical protein
MIRKGVLAGLMAVMPGCLPPAAAWKGTVEWPTGNSTVRAIVSPFEAGAALAAAGAIRELIRTNTDPRLFRGCSSPEQGLDVAVFTGPTPGLYYVSLEQRFHRCGGSSGRVLDWWYVYAVTPQGEVVAEAPLPPGEPPAGPLPQPAPPPPEPTPPPAAVPASEQPLSTPP